MRQSTSLSPPGPPTRPSHRGDTALEWLSLLDDLYGRVEADGPGLLAAPITAWPATWRSLAHRWAERIGAREVTRLDATAMPVRSSPCTLHAPPPKHRPHWPAFRAHSLSARGFDAAQAAEFEAFCSHLHTALELGTLLHDTQRHLASLYGVIDTLPIGVALLDAHLNVLLVNSAALDWLARIGGTLQGGLRLPSHQALFDQKLKHFAADGLQRHGQLQLAFADIALSKLAAPTVALQPHLRNGPPTLQCTTLLLIREHRGPAPADALATPPPLLAHHLQHHLGLTDSELPLAWNLAQGVALKQYAARSGRATETVRVQLKSVFRKLGVSNQTQVSVAVFDALHAVTLRAFGEHLAAAR